MKRKAKTETAIDLKSRVPEILERLAKGESLNAICKGEGMPDERTVRGWAKDDVDGFGPKYARARELGYEVMAEDLLTIADDGTNDTDTDEDGNTFTDHEVIARSRLRVDTRKWLLSKMLPKVYGDKLDVTSGGQTLRAPIVTIDRTPPRA